MDHALKIMSKTKFKLSCPKCGQKEVMQVGDMLTCPCGHDFDIPPLHTPRQWNETLNTRILDWDGFRDSGLEVLMCREEFEHRLIHCSLMMSNPFPMGTEKNVCEDIARRQAFGLTKYGVSVADNPLNLRQWLQHAYEETLDQAIYLRRAIDQIDKEACEANAKQESSI